MNLTERSDPELTDITAIAAERTAYDNHESVWHAIDAKSGLSAIIAIHSSVLGPGLGGTRFHQYRSRDEALDDVLRLSRGMTFKAAIAGLPLGGGKAVVMTGSGSEKSPELLSAYAKVLSRLRGKFVTAEDVGMTTADADFLRERTDNVTGTSIGGSGNPAPFTAHGVFLGIRAAAEFAFGNGDLSGRKVAVQGLGSVGMALCNLLNAEGAALAVADISRSLVKEAAGRFGAAVVDPAVILEEKADIFAPCALGAILSQKTIPGLGAKIVAGSANNVLAVHGDGRILKDAGVLYAPDYVINAGGLINVAAELAPDGYDKAAVLSGIEKIPATLKRIFDRSKRDDLPTNDVAQAIALERIADAKVN